MTQPEATLIAAVIAASATVITLLFTLMNKRGEEYRTAHRAVVVEDLKAIGKCVHEVLALSNIQMKTMAGTQHPERYRNAAAAAKRLKEMRLDVRYTLWGIDDALRTLSRLPDWIGHAKLSPETAHILFKQAKVIGEQIDIAVRVAYIDSRSPSRYRLFCINRAVKRFKKTYEAYSNSRGSAN